MWYDTQSFASTILYVMSHSSVWDSLTRGKEIMCFGTPLSLSHLPSLNIPHTPHTHTHTRSCICSYANNVPATMTNIRIATTNHYQSLSSSTTLPVPTTYHTSFPASPDSLQRLGSGDDLDIFGIAVYRSSIPKQMRT